MRKCLHVLQSRMLRHTHEAGQNLRLGRRWENTDCVGLVCSIPYKRKTMDQSLSILVVNPPSA